MNVDPATTDFLALRLRLRLFASRMLRSEAEADDALQELFVRTWRKTPPTGRSAFLFAALRNICTDTLRRRRFASDEPPPDAPDGHADTQRRTADRDMLRHIDRFVRLNLHGNMRRVFEMHVYEQLDYDEIAQRLDISNESVRAAMSRARKAIRQFAKQQ